MENIFRIFAVVLVVFYMFCINVIKADAEWTRLNEIDDDEIDFYVDVETIRKHDGYVYFWSLYDFVKPIEDSLSASSYFQGDCNTFKMKALSMLTYKEPMAGGNYDEDTSDGVSKWRYPTPDSIMYYILNFICDKAK